MGEFVLVSRVVFEVELNCPLPGSTLLPFVEGLGNNALEHLIDREIFLALSHLFAL